MDLALVLEFDRQKIIAGMQIAILLISDAIAK